MTDPICSSDRWTCPTCGRTVVVDGSDADIRCALRACQKRHAAGHRAATEVLARYGLPDPVAAVRHGEVQGRPRRKTA